MIKVNAIGDACPIPVVKTKNAIRDLGGSGVVEVSVDNEIAVQNLLKMAKQKEYEAKFDKKSNTEYIVTINVNSEVISDTKVTNDSSDEIKLKQTVVVIDSDKMGDGEEEFSKTLLKGFIYALSSQDIPPAKIIFYNTGVRMTTEGSASIEDLKVLLNAGAKIYSCGACLNNYGLSEKLQVGEVTNMYDIVGHLMDADLVIRP
ncbi:sulfurtransferase-like selenium metabolism protein YedF [Lachnoanaerobaculum umeaense]|uniref:Sulfurtransferase-like selenium metabolism protein YedF n=1 Tax=Lachnoanaerobaculum umeaense TaxID=617123 RepID=A0A385Q0D5_9FIRM|nr:sulfurtransferase-like selenium metabolism protein YedF [Lachnoanaerobaculum umeaense]AYA99017.1 sulfurtransferase-like selenium metabolism protein YedF [Lachnoanaerobaculum umeaense]PZW95156.1 selenium metabolism protein YedF [Lachnoanaerobaculum umeaense]